MNWFIWQQHRKQFLVFGIFLVIYAAVVIPTGLHFWHHYQQALSICNTTQNCHQLDGLFTTSIDQIIFHVIPLTVLAVPFLLGLFWGTPLIAQEYISGTNKLVWTQSVSRRKWLTVKLAWMLIAAAVFAGAFAALNTWWARTGNAMYMSHTGATDFGFLDRFGKLIFGTQGIVAAAYAVFAVALGAAFGTWFKQILSAIGVTAIVLLAVQIAVPNVVRPHFGTPRTYTASLPSNMSAPDPFTDAPRQNGSGATWVVSGDIVDNQGHILNLADPPAKCSSAFQTGTITQSITCATKLGYHWSVAYQPSSRYWDFQWLETALYLGLAAIPIGVTYWLVLKRDA